MRFTYTNGAQPLQGFTIQRGIHRGGFGEVYFAHSDSGKEVALKLLHDQDHETEIRGVMQCLNLKHPNLVNIFDVKTDSGGDHWVVMEYVTGSSLEDVLASFPDGLPLVEVRDWLSGLVAGVAHLHDRGIVHRDLKPANVYRENGIVKVGDVGLSKRLGSDHRGQHTQSVGTVYYMAPEVAQGKYGPEVDVYSLGVMLYELITGKLPFTGETTAEILMKHLTALPDLTVIPKSIRPTLARALEKDPRNRTSTVRQLEQDFLQASGTPMDSISSRIVSSPPPIPPRETAAARDEPAPWISVCVNRPLPSRFSSSEDSPSRTMRQWSGVWENPSIPILLIFPFSALFLIWGNGNGVPSWILVLGAFVIIVKVFQEFTGQPRPYRQAKRTRESFELMPETLRRAAARRASADDDSVRLFPRRNGKLPDEMPNSIPPVQKTKPSGSDSAHKRPWNEILAELGQSLGKAGWIASLISAGVYLSLDTVHLTRMMPSTPNAVLFAAVSVIGSWLLLINNAVNVNSSLTRRQRWHVRLATGAMIGTCAYALNQFLIVHTPSSAYTMKSVVSSLGSRPLTVAGVDPTWLGYVVFFSAWLAVRSWSREMIAVRRKQLSLLHVAASVAIAYVVSILFAFPQWYGMFWAGTISATIQLSSAWTPKPHSWRGW